MGELVNASFASVRTHVQFPEPMWGLMFVIPALGKESQVDLLGWLASLALLKGIRPKRHPVFKEVDSWSKTST